MKQSFSVWNMNFQRKFHTTPDIPSEAATENNTYATSLNMVDLLCFCSQSHTLAKWQGFIPVQKERVILFVTLLSYHRNEVLILVTAAHRPVLFYPNDELFLL